MNRQKLCLLLLPLLLAACASASPSVEPPPLASPSPTPFQADQPTATPTEIQAWLSPALPAELAASVESLGQIDGRPLQWVEKVEAAELRFEAEPQEPLSQWVYVVAAPFATLEDGLPAAELEASFKGQGPWEIYSDPSTQSAWMARWSQPANQTVPAAELLASVKQADGPALALMEFGNLNLQWKLFSVDGQSPLATNFELNSYPLLMSFGVSGPPELRQAAAAALAWPETNWQEDKLTTVAITGVTALTRATAWAIDVQGINWAAGQVAPILANADITHISHEVAFSRSCPAVNPSRDVMRFCGQPEQIEVMAMVGTDVVELTGNHVMDYGPEALLETLTMYDERGWLRYGGGRDLEDASEPAFIEHHGNRFVFLGCNSAGPNFAWASSQGPGAMPCHLEALYDQIAELRAEGYLPIVTFQWAESYSDWPLPLQAEAFRQAAQAGAVVVSGSQAHRPQGFEFSDNGFIHFGLGNLFFDQMWSLETRQEFIDLYHFYRGQLINVELTTWMLEDYARVRPMTRDERDQFLGAIFSTSGY